MKDKIIRYGLGTLLLLIVALGLLGIKSLLFVVSIIFIIIGLREYRNILSNISVYPHKFLPEIICILISLVLCFSTGTSTAQNLVTPLLVLGVMISFVITIIRNKKPYLLTTLTTIGGILLTFCGMYMIKLTYLAKYKGNFSSLLIIAYIIAILLSDYLASIIGPLFKNWKSLSKEISPNKTLAGSIAHLLTSIISSMILLKIIGYNHLLSIGFGIIISIFAQFGDLAISTIKRDCGVEHSGKFFLSYGGFLDRMDSFIFSAPALYYYLFIMLYIYKQPV